MLGALTVAYVYINVYKKLISSFYNQVKSKIPNSKSEVPFIT